MTAGPGLFVAVEGAGGVGKSTAVEAVARLLRQQGVPVLATREPTDSPLGNLARSGTDEYRGEAMACLIAADRHRHGDTIRLALEAGKVVLCDRHVASSLVLQVMDGVDREFVWLLNEGVLLPDVVVIIHAPAAAVEARLTGRGAHSRYERMADSTAIESAYYAEAGSFLRGKGLRVRDLHVGNAGAEEVAAALLAVINEVREDPNHAARRPGRADVQPQQPLPGARGEAVRLPRGAAGVGARPHGDGAQQGV